MGTTSITDVLTVVYREGLLAVAIDPVSSGIRLTFTGTAEQAHSIQRAPAVTGSWTSIEKQTAPPSGLVQYNDVSRLPAAAFYRTVQP